MPKFAQQKTVRHIAPGKMESHFSSQNHNNLLEFKGHGKHCPKCNSIGPSKEGDFLRFKELNKEQIQAEKEEATAYREALLKKLTPDNTSLLKKAASIIERMIHGDSGQAKNTHRKHKK